MDEITVIEHGAFRVVPAKLEHIEPVAFHMREADRQECWAGLGQPPYDALMGSLAASPRAWTIMKGERPVAMFGVAQRALLSSTGIPWLLGAEGLDEAGTMLARFGRPVVEVFASRYRRLENWVDARYVKAVRWIEWMGFTVDDPVAFGPSGMLFHRFWMER